MVWVILDMRYICRYPLWSSYYGSKRPVDGAIALDRWGSNHESWLRTEETPPILENICARIRSEFDMSDDCMNSILVNYYYDGESTWIPAHRDTTTCLKEGSSFFCLSLGETSCGCCKPSHDFDLFTGAK